MQSLTKTLPQPCFFSAVLVLVILLLGAAGPAAWSQESNPAQSDPAQSDPQATRLYRNAVALQNRELYDLAADEWAAFLQQFGEDPLAAKARHYRGVCLFQLQQYAAAETEFTDVTRGYPNFELLEETYANLGLARYNLAQAGNPDSDSQVVQIQQQAIETLSKQLEKFPDGPLAPQACFYRAEALYALGQLAEATASYQPFLERYRQHPLRPQALYGMGVAQQESNKPAEAAPIFAKFLSDYPQHELTTEVTLRTGEILLAAGNAQAAEKHFAQVAAHAEFPDADYALQQQAVCRYDLGDYAGAGKLYRALESRFPESDLIGTAKLAAGKCHYLEGDDPAAVECLRQAQAAGGEASAEASHWLTRALIRLEQPAEALATVEAALAAGPNTETSITLAMDRADVLLSITDRRGDAIEAYANIANQHVQHAIAPEARYLAAHSAFAQADYPTAKKQSGQFLQNFPEHNLTPDVLNIRAETELQLGETTAAAEKFRQLIDRYPESEEHANWTVRLAVAYALAQQWPEIIEFLEPRWNTLPEGPLRAEAGLLLGKACQATGASEQAVDVLGQVASSTPAWEQADDVLLQLAAARLALGDSAQAKSTYRLLLDTKPHSELLPVALLALARLQSNTGEDQNAKNSLDQLLTAHPQHEAARQGYLMRANVLHKLDQPAAALKDVDAFLKTNPDRDAMSNAIYLRGLSQASLKQYGNAEQTYRSILKQHPKFAAADQVLYELAWARHDGGQGDATALFRQLAENYPTSPLAAECWYRVGESQYAADDAHAAIHSFSQAEAKATTNQLREKAIHKQSWSHFHQGNHDQAKAGFGRQVEAFPDGNLVADARLMIAEANFQSKNYPEALRLFSEELPKANTNKPLMAISLLHAGQAASQIEQWDTSLELLERCIREHPAAETVDEARYELGWAMYNLGRLDEALPLFEQIANRNQSVLGARSQFMIGEVHFGEKRYDAAVRMFFRVFDGYGEKQALPEFHHWQAEAMFEAARCLEQTGRTKSAHKLYRELIERFSNSEKATHAQNKLQ